MNETFDNLIAYGLVWMAFIAAGLVCFGFMVYNVLKPVRRKIRKGMQI